MKTYSDLIQIPTFNDRFEYLSIKQSVGDPTFGVHRYLNQKLYKSKTYLNFRDSMIVRDRGFEMALCGYPIHGSVHLHHINPITIDQVIHRDPIIFDPQNVVCVSDFLHKAIHYGSNPTQYTPAIRTPNDTAPWLHERR